VNLDVTHGINIAEAHAHVGNLDVLPHQRSPLFGGPLGRRSAWCRPAENRLLVCIYTADGCPPFSGPISRWLPATIQAA
jgi:hypothetical protein